MTTYVIGISAFYHDSAACLIRDDRIVATAQEERFTRKKFDTGFPSQASRYCLEAGGINLQDMRLMANGPARRTGICRISKRAITSHEVSPYSTALEFEMIELRKAISWISHRLYCNILD